MSHDENILERFEAGGHTVYIDFFAREYPDNRTVCLNIDDDFIPMSPDEASRLGMQLLKAAAWSHQCPTTLSIKESIKT